MRGQTTNAKIETRKERARLQAKEYHAPHWRKLLSGVALGYCKPESGGAGTWRVRWREGSVYRMQNLRSRDGTFVVADDMAPADGVTVLNYEQALDAARAIAKTAGLGGGGRDPLLTVDQAVTAYADYLAEQGRCSKNVSRMRHHLPNELGNLLVAKLTKADFNEWNKRLAKSGMQRASINRTNTPLKAALNFAKLSDERIERNPWMAALKRLRNVTVARNVVLSEEEVIGIVTAAHEDSPEFGLFVEVLAQTGARPKQIAGTEVGALKLDRDAPRLEIPASRKGSADKPLKPGIAPIPLDLALRLKAGAKGKPATALLLTMPDGSSWEGTETRHRRRFESAVRRYDERLADMGKDGEAVTSYALRHTHITRQIQAGVHPSVIAATHDTSTKQIDDHYGANIDAFTDAMSRRTLLDMKPLAGNVVRLRK